MIDIETFGLRKIGFKSSIRLFAVSGMLGAQILMYCVFYQIGIFIFSDDIAQHDGCGYLSITEKLGSNLLSV